MNPFNQFIEITPGSTASTAVIPQDKGNERPIASIEYGLPSLSVLRHQIQLHSLTAIVDGSYYCF